MPQLPFLLYLFSSAGMLQQAESHRWKTPLGPKQAQRLINFAYSNYGIV